MNAACRRDGTVKPVLNGDTVTHKITDVDRTCTYSAGHFDGCPEILDGSPTIVEENVEGWIATRKG